MKFVFDIHNTMGRFWNENIYKEKVQKLCKKYGINVLCEVPIKVTFKDFYKYYFLDLLIENSVIYELKTVDSLSKKDEQQLINECTVLIFSGISKYYKNYACQISEMLKYTNLKYAQWANFNNNEIKLTTIKK